MGGPAEAAFTANMTPEAILAFYQDELPSLGWMSETEGEVVSYPDKGGTGVIRVGQWTLTKGDLRLVIYTGQPSKDAPPGELATQLIVQPVWFSGLNSYGIPSICALPSSISGLRPTSAACGSP